MTALGAAARQHLAAIGGLHALAETMHGFAAFAMRLERTFHSVVFFTFTKSPVENQAWFQLPTGHHTRGFCERTAKVREMAENREQGPEIFGAGLLNAAMGF